MINSSSENADGDKPSRVDSRGTVSGAVDQHEEELDLEWEEWDPSRLSFTDHMLAGSFAGLAEHVCIFPMDTLKTNMQCDQCDGARGRAGPGPFQTVKCAQRIVQQSGMMRLWRGVSAMFAGCIPAHAAYFSIFESLKVALGADREGHYPLHAALCGASATLVHDLMMTPFDVVKQRMQLGYHRSVLDCARSIVKTEGTRAFYLSFPTTVAMNLPYGCVMVAVNESSRKVILGRMKPAGGGSGAHSQTQRMSASMLAGGVAGGVAALVTTPLDVVKTRLQTQNLVSKTLGNSLPTPVPCPAFTQAKRHIVSTSVASCPAGAKVPCSTGRPASGAAAAEFVVAQRYRSMAQTFRAVVTEEGALSLLRGAVPRILVHAPSVAISWTAYEFAKGLLAGSKQE